MQAADVIHQSWNFIQQLFTLDPQEPFKAGAKVAAILGAAVTVVATLISKTYPWLRAKIESRSVSRIFGEDLFTPKSIERAIRYYIPPLCQSIDPAGGEESRLIHAYKPRFSKPSIRLSVQGLKRNITSCSPTLEWVRPAP